MHKPIFLNNVSLSFDDSNCFENFSTQITYGAHVAIIGLNGAGKSSLLKIIKGDLFPTSGTISNNKNIIFGYVPQLIYEYRNLSGAERFNKALSLAFANQPDVLLLDEPTNHLDLQNRSSLMKMLNFYKGTLIMVSHDKELLKNVHSFWHIDNKKITVFNGIFDDYFNLISQNRQNFEDELKTLTKEKKETHKALMKEQERAKKSKEKGEKFVAQKKWLPSLGDLKASYARKSAGQKYADNRAKREFLHERLANLRIPEPLKPSFTLKPKDISTNKAIVSISSGHVGYNGTQILKNINLFVMGNDHLAIVGNNGSGKTTLLKAILNCPEVNKDGLWDIPNVQDIGYLDQHYSFLDDAKTVIETIMDLSPDKTLSEIRSFLNDFLFRKNEEVNKPISVLSGGEKARLSLAKIAVKTPKLLLLDEITNNIDLEAKEHVMQVLKEYPGAIVMVSHDTAFLEQLNISNKYVIPNN
ncbi:MAG: ATP-binding cassette domain-containing protein [Endomicrobium sp.]|jgi:ATPase subunit of ABC transporter with duplicated ATPase domains|uniref:ABC-F family ATP-binding cassette domain-containing protein n=1 Tax=Candidatus Endomicrobiellum cubanum TaxID=3242325 RepID=UPI002834EE50|nr:ATP-binding cassette domain-containing protein [Endomicrobium sp.]